MRPALQRPSVIRRLVAGAWHAPHALLVFARTPSLWPLGLPAVVVTAVCVHLGVVAGAFLIPRAEPIVTPAPGRATPELDIAFTLMLWLGGLGAGALFGLACGLLVVAPLLDLLARRRDPSPSREAGPTRGARMLQSVAASLILLLVSAVVVPAALVPLTGPLLGAVLAASLLGARGATPALVSRGQDSRARLAWFRAWLPETTGLGLATIVLLLVPGINLLVAPMLWIGGTDLVRELTELPPPAGEDEDESPESDATGEETSVEESAPEEEEDPSHESTPVATP